jgi:hypothetical protein
MFYLFSLIPFISANAEFCSSVTVQGDVSISCKGGKCFETKKTPQIVPDTGESRCVSGDGTVPYVSMRYFCFTNIIISFL